MFSIGEFARLGAKIPAMGVVAIGGTAPSIGPEYAVPVVNRARAQFDEFDIAGLATVTGPFMVFFEDHDTDEATIYLALPVAEPPAELPRPPGTWCCPRSRR